MWQYCVVAHLLVSVFGEAFVDVILRPRVWTLQQFSQTQCTPPPRNIRGCSSLQCWKWQKIYIFIGDLGQIAEEELDHKRISESQNEENCVINERTVVIPDLHNRSSAKNVLGNQMDRTDQC